MKKSLYCILSLILGIGFVGAQSISLIPQGDGKFGNNCLVPIDVYVDTEGQEISAMDLMLETSLQYKDFVPTEFFPYFFPPIMNEKGQIHIVGFTVDPSERLNGSGKIGTLYFNQRNNAIDGVVRLYFLEEGNTTDTNLSIAGGVDVLKNILGAYVVFSDELESCEPLNIEGENLEDDEDNIQEAQNGEVISGGFSDKTWDESLEDTFEKIEAKYEKTTWQKIKNKVYIISLSVLLLIILLLLIKNILSFEKESDKGKSKHKKK